MQSLQPTTCLIVGGRGYVGSAIAAAAEAAGWLVTSVGREDYAQLVGSTYDIVINANGNASRFRANRDPLFDFEASAASVYRSLFDFQYSHYVLLSSVDVYHDHANMDATAEDTPVDLADLCPYGFHKRLAELFVQRQCKRWHVFRLAQMVGPNAKKGPIYDLLKRRPLWIHPDSRLHFMSTRNVGRAVVYLIEHAPANEIYNVCGRGSVVFRRILELLPVQWQPVEYRESAKDEYCIRTEKACRVVPLPDSWDEISQFLHESITCERVKE